jgi:tRNA nucleotidyltransferase (CCA-adding enzyme)
VSHAVLDRMAKVFTTALAALEGEEGVWAVGGAVRDALLERPPRELDLVVEGDAVAVAQRVAARLDGEVVEHERFGTATVRAPGGVLLDLAAARRETYPRPGALPEVALGASVEEDLARRDFSVNALAVRPADGALAGVPGGEADLRAGVLRVLHDASFRDDPTRLVRLARYAARLGFAIDPHTAELAEAAVSEGALGTVTGERLGAELRLLAREPQPAALQALERFRLGAALLPGFAVDAGLARRALALAGEAGDARPDRVALAAALRGDAPAGALAARLRELAFPAADAAAIVAAAGVDAGALAGARPSEADAALARLPVEAAVMAAAEGAEPARAWIERGRRERLAIDGDDLLAAGLSGPAIGRGLAAARAALLDGAAPTRDDQLAAALDAAR